MPLEDVSNDSSMIGWLRQAGHGHLLENQQDYSNLASSAPPPSQPPHPQALSPSPPPPRISGGYGDTDQYNHSGSFAQHTNFNPQSYGTQQSPTNFVSSPSQFLAPHMNSQLDIDIEVSAIHFSISIHFLFS